MVIKSFVGSNVAEALKLIRSELGPKAVVLKTRALKAEESGSGRRMVEITACLERPSIGVIDKVSSAPSLGRSERLKRLKKAADPKRNETGVSVEELEKSIEEASAKDSKTKSPVTGSELRPGSIDIGDTEAFARRLEEKLDLILDTQLSSKVGASYAPDVAEIVELLSAHDMPERLLQPLIKDLIERQKKQSGSKARDLIERALVEKFALHCLPEFALQPGDVALFIGPSGSGKTSALGKYAVDLIFNRKIKTELSTLDDFRVAAHEEIAGYSEALGAELVDLQAFVRDRGRSRKQSETVTLIDCHSNIYDQNRYATLIERVQELNPSVVFMTISALTRSADLMRLLKRFDQLNPTHLIVTHTDLTDAVGGIYAALDERDMKLVTLTNSAGSVGELLTPDPALMARRMLRRPQ